MCRKSCRRLLLLLITCWCVQIVSAQTGKITGKILNAKNEPLVGVTLKLDGKKVTATSDIEGIYKITVEANKAHTLSFAFVGHQDKTITDLKVAASKTEVLDIVMEDASNELDKVVIRSAAGARRETAASLLAFQKSNISVSDGISAESIKKSPDNNVGEVLKRVSGASVQDDKFVVIRGLTDRYNVATINGALMPSTEPDRRAFSFDVIPSGMIDNVIINKTATPDMPGEFAGGIIQVTTKDIPTVNSMGIGVGAGYNTISTGKDFRFGKIKSADYLGFDNGLREMPAGIPKTVENYRLLSADQKIAASKLFNNNYGVRYNGSALPAFNGQFNIARKYDVKNGGTIGVIGAINYRNSQKIEYADRLQYGNIVDDKDVQVRLRDSSYMFETNIGGLLNIGYKKGSSKIVFKNVYNRVFENKFTVREGSDEGTSQYIKDQIGRLVQKSMLSSQVEGEHALGLDKLKWNVSFANTKRNMPDYRAQPYVKNIDEIDNKAAVMSLNPRDAYKFFSDLNEYTYGAKVDYTKTIKFLAPKSQLKAGILGQLKDRKFDNRQFRPETAGGSNFDASLLNYTPETIFNKDNFRSNGFYFEEITNTNDRYTANSHLYAGYAMLDNKFSDAFRLIWGLRVENFGYTMKTADISGLRVNLDKNYIDFLPSLNAIYSLNTKNNIRLSASRTVARPELRELAAFQFYDLENKWIVAGNTGLKRAQISNFDLRYEFYPTSGEIISGTVFYKHFKDPIELMQNSASTLSLGYYRYENPNSATAFGAEIDLRKSLSFINNTSSVFKSLYVTANASIIKSKVNTSGRDLSIYDANRPLQGQSPYLVNIGLNYTNPDNVVSATVLFNRIGARIDAVGSESIPETYENGRSMLDAQIAVKVLNKKGELKLNASNILNQKQVFYQNTVNDIKERSYNKEKDRVVRSFLQGTGLTASFVYNF